MFLLNFILLTVEMGIEVGLKWRGGGGLEGGVNKREHMYVADLSRFFSF